MTFGSLLNLSGLPQLKSEAQVVIQVLFSQKDVRNSVMDEFWHRIGLTLDMCILFLIRFYSVCLVFELLLKPLRGGLKRSWSGMRWSYTTACQSNR